ncbi:MAG: hypothetical protein ORN51_04975 [Akkermansiaceae bacterium]|nr:hypothetical protein [Akkermansiaceae bacterium]
MPNTINTVAQIKEITGVCRQTIFTYRDKLVAGGVEGLLKRGWAGAREPVSTGGGIWPPAEFTDRQPAPPQPQAAEGSSHRGGQRLDHPGQGPLDDPQLDARSGKRWRSALKSNC